MPVVGVLKFQNFLNWRKQMVSNGITFQKDLTLVRNRIWFKDLAAEVSQKF